MIRQWGARERGVVESDVALPVGGDRQVCFDGVGSGYSLNEIRGDAARGQVGDSRVTGLGGADGGEVGGGISESGDGRERVWRVATESILTMDDVPLAGGPCGVGDRNVVVRESAEPDDHAPATASFGETPS